MPGGGGQRGKEGRGPAWGPTIKNLHRGPKAAPKGGAE